MWVGMCVCNLSYLFGLFDTATTNKRERILTLSSYDNRNIVYITSIEYITNIVCRVHVQVRNDVLHTHGRLHTRQMSTT